MRWAVLIAAAAVVAVTAAGRFDSPATCVRSPENNDTSSGRSAVTCRVRTLDADGDALNGLPSEGTARLRVRCSERLMYESALPALGIQRLHHLEELTIESCKLLLVPPEAFTGLRGLRRLNISTRDADWGPGRSLVLNTASFSGLKELQTLYLGNNNMRAVPDDVFCELVNLQSLNLTRNRLRNPERFGFSGGVHCAGTDLQTLDVSYNELRTLPENSGLARLRRLQNLDLQANAIREISGEALAGLASLRVFDISANQLEALPQGLFAGSRDLREIRLRNNSIFSLSKGLFHRLDQLLILDLSANRLTSGQIDAGTFSGLIRLIVLNLSHNALTRLDSRTFADLFFLQILDLRNNSIGFIEDNTFLPLYNLHTLNLAENRLNTIGPLLFNGLFVLSKLTINNNLIVSVDSLAFRNCSDLKELDLSANSIREVPDAVKELPFLKTLDLGENQIADFRNGSFRGLGQLTGLRLIDNLIGNLTRGMLWDLPSLQVLNLAKNKVQSIERGSFDRNTQIEAIRFDENYLIDVNGIFATLTTLLWLNLSGNQLVWFDFAFIPNNLKWLDIHGNFIESLGNYYRIRDDIHIKTLDVSHNRITEIGPLSVPDSIELLFINNNLVSKILPGTFADKPYLVRVDMYANEVRHIDLNALQLSPEAGARETPTEFYVGGNPFECDCSMEWLQRINEDPEGPRQYPRLVDLENILCRTAHSRGAAHLPLRLARPSDFLCVYETHCFALCHCCDFDACDCEMLCPANCTCYHDQTWGTNVVDCSGLGAGSVPQRIPMDATELYLDGNDLKELRNHVLIGRKNLKVLYVNASGVQGIQNRTFNGLTALQSLHLEDNRIKELRGFEFEHLSHLRRLYLQNNLIRYIGNLTLLPLRSLEVLRLDGNRLVTFPVWQLTLNSQLKELRLGDNRWSCRCKFLQELAAWMADNARKVIDANDVWCFDDGSRPPQRRELDLNGTACSDFYAGGSLVDGALVADYLPTAAATLAVLLLLLIFLALWFAFRDLVRVWLFARYGLRLGSASAPADRDKLYDAYVCYSPKDEEFVVRSVAGELENGDPSFHLCLHYRDLPHAAYLQRAAPAALEAADASRRVVIVLTRNFLQTEWSRFELRQAMHEALKGRTSQLVIVEEGPTPQEAELDPELRPYLKTGRRLQWGEKRFWHKLRYSMPPSASPRPKVNANYAANINNYTIETTVVVSNNAREKVPPSPAAVLGRQVARPQEPPDHDDANYSSATTATPSPRPQRRHHHPPPHEPRPLSDHIYSSIDSDYSTLERGASGRRPHVELRGPPWRPGHAVLNANGVQAYLV